jgi:hypothetical protein
VTDAIEFLGMVALALAGIAFVLGLVMLILWQTVWIVQKINSLRDRSNLLYTDAYIPPHFR